jgi:diguanylate cyclase (GGDEF)-like protein
MSNRRATRKSGQSARDSCAELKFGTPAAENRVEMCQRSKPPPRLPLHLWLLALLVWLAAATATTAAAAAPEAPAGPALLVDGRASLAVWPSVSLHREGGKPLQIEQLLSHPQHFTVPTGTPGNLARVSEAVWLRVPLQVPGAEASRRVLEFDYPSLNRIDVYLVQGGQVIARHAMGNALRVAERPLPSRSHAVALTLPAGDSELLVRVQTSSSMVLPITLRTPEAFTVQESQAQLLQGIVVGLGLCMLLYSLTHWVSLRDRLFLDYGLLLSGNLVFMVTYFGLGGLYLWPDMPSLSMQLSPLAVLLAVAAGTRFMRTVLVMDENYRHTARFTRMAGWAALASIGVTVAGLIDYRLAQSLATFLGLLTTLVVLPVAFHRARHGERAATYMLVGWAFYVAGALCIAGLLRGLVEPTFWAQYVYPFSTLIEMSAWMGVLGLRVQSIHRSADRARVESEGLRTLAHTDALTGLPNRRGLQERLEAALCRAQPDQLLAVFLLDLDGFKPVNDRYGHDVGDALLVAVGRRLQNELRGADVVARLGGDEFVVLASGLSDEAAAQSVGQKMLASFNAPFDIGGQVCKVGLTIGYALAPLDANDGNELLKRADAAMYAGKNAGRHRLERGGRRAVATA